MFQCITSHAKENKRCPYKNCETILSADMEAIKEFENRLRIMFPEVEEAEGAEAPVVRPSDSDPIVCVVRITGESDIFLYEPSKTIADLKDEIKIELDIDHEKQELVYKGRELCDYDASTGKLACLSDYDVKPNEKINLIVLLYAIPPHLNEVTFDLSWDYPATRKDYLDATCLVYNGQKFKKLVDFSNSYMAPSSAETFVGAEEKRDRVVSKFKVDESQISIQHTSDKHMDDAARKGKHTINVFLKRLPADISHIFFVLSAWEYPTIANFPNPGLKFYETSRPSRNLCETSFTHALNSSAVIMCSISRKGDIWNIARSGALSSGNAKNYGPMKDKIRELIGISHGALPGTDDEDSDAIEIAFSFDTTGSMYEYLDELRKKLKETVERLVKDIPNIRIALLAHGDYDCQHSYVLRTLDFTNDVSKLVDFAMNTPKTGGSGPPECYEWMLHEASRRLSWSDNDQFTKALVVLGDATPHPPSFTDQHIHWKHELGILKQKGVKIFGVQVRGIAKNTPFYQMISEYTGGAYVEFGQFNAISDLFLALCYKCAGDEKFNEFQSEIQGRDTGESFVMVMLQQIAKSGQTQSGSFADRWRLKTDWWDPDMYDKGSQEFSYSKSSDMWTHTGTDDKIQKYIRRKQTVAFK